MRNVIGVRFHDDANAYKALTRLAELDRKGEAKLTGAAVVLRERDGRVVTKDAVGDTGLVEKSALGGVLGLLIGSIGGPLGALLVGTAGVVTGALIDQDDSAETTSALDAMSRCARVGHTALLAEVGESNPEVIDAAMAGLGGTVERKRLDDVKAEIAGAAAAERAARDGARRQLREQR